VQWLVVVATQIELLWIPQVEILDVISVAGVVSGLMKVLVDERPASDQDAAEEVEQYALSQHRPQE